MRPTRGGGGQRALLYCSLGPPHRPTAPRHTRPRLVPVSQSLHGSGSPGQNLAQNLENLGTLGLLKNPPMAANPGAPGLAFHSLIGFFYSFPVRAVRPLGIRGYRSTFCPEIRNFLKFFFARSANPQLQPRQDVTIGPLSGRGRKGAKITVLGPKALLNLHVIRMARTIDFGFRIAECGMSEEGRRSYQAGRRS